MLAYFPERKRAECIVAATKVQQAIEESSLLPVGVGCDFGEVIMGDLGQEARLDYTLIGAAVNFAARMCDSAGKGEIAVSARFFDNLSEHIRESVGSSYSSKRITVKIKATDPEREGVLLTRNH